ncbi:MAG: hypothetical protein IPH66_16300 [Crocinitomicaceae bacterium]|nr:hypothetical protein [Crocinitomicaceae bacterium]
MKYSKIYILPLFLCLMIFSCAGNDQAITGEQKEFSTESEPMQDSLLPSAPLISDSLHQELQKYFDDETLTEIESFIEEFDTVKTDTAFKAVYDKGLVLFHKMYDAVTEPQTNYLKEAMTDDGIGFYTVIEDLNKMNGLLAPLYFSCVAECSDYDFSFDLLALQNKSLETSGKQDDDFMELLLMIEDRAYGYVGYGDFKAWHIQYTDISGSTRLGDGILLNIITKMQEIKPRIPLFKKEFQRMHEEVLDVLNSIHIYEFSPEEVQAEYTKILRLNYFTGDEKASIEKCRDELKANQDSYQFNCKDGGCSYE